MVIVMLFSVDIFHLRKLDASLTPLLDSIYFPDYGQKLYFIFHIYSVKPFLDDHLWLHIRISLLLLVIYLSDHSLNKRLDCINLPVTNH